MLSEEMKGLIEKYLNGSATEDEKAEVLNWYRSVDHSLVEADISSEEELNDIKQKIFLNTRQYISSTAKIIFLKKWRYVFAAAAIVLVFFSTYIFFQHTAKPSSVIAKTAEHLDIVPGHTGAVLHLSNGQSIVLDSAGDGTLALQGGIKIIKQNGEIKYVGKTDEVLYNTISTAKGRQWQIILPDGTKVWLNAASSIRYPLSFIAKERTVEITGEAYFDVFHNAVQPFKIKTGNQIIEDIGTEFNVNAYADEPIAKTTLIKGSVRIKLNDNAVTLKPGEQAEVKERIKVRTDVDFENVLAWKNGLFRFQDATLQSVMLQVARWYNVQIVYQGFPKEHLFTGTIPRDIPITQLFSILDEAGISFTIEKIPTSESEGKIIINQ